MGATHRTESSSRPSGPGDGPGPAAELARDPADLVWSTRSRSGRWTACGPRGCVAVLEHSSTALLGMLRRTARLALRARGLRPGRAMREAAVRVVTSLPELDPVRPGGTVLPGRSGRGVETRASEGARRSSSPQHVRLRRDGRAAAVRSLDACSDLPGAGHRHHRASASTPGSLPAPAGVEAAPDVPAPS